jgi:hypothetical protein
MGEKMAQRIAAYAAETKSSAEETLRILLEADRPEALQRPPRGNERISPASVLRACLLGIEARSLDEARLQLARSQTPETELRGLWSGEKTKRAPRRPESGEQRRGEHPDSLQILSRLLARDAEEAWSKYRGENARPPLNSWRAGWEDGFSRLAHGVPQRVDRLRGLGNAVVPAQAREAFRRLMGLDRMKRS